VRTGDVVAAVWAVADLTDQVQRGAAVAPRGVIRAGRRRVPYVSLALCTLGAPQEQLRHFPDPVPEHEGGA
jgi:hypothetical protein